MQCSVWRNVYDCNEEEGRPVVSVGEFIEQVRTGKYKKEVELYRAEENKEAKAEIKKGLVAVTLSGVFRVRKATELIAHSGFICLDFDNVSNLSESKAAIAVDRYASSVFTTISGKGLAVLVRIVGARHREAFIGLEEYFYSMYNLVADGACRDVCRVRTISFDPDASFDSARAVFERYPKAEKPKKSYAPIPCTNSDIGKIVSQAVEKGIDLCPRYEDWQRLAAALATRGEEGRGYFHQLSALNPKYNHAQCDKKYTNLLDTADGRITIGTFYHYAKQAGLQTNREKAVGIVKVCKEVKKINGKTADNAIARLKEKKLICCGKEEENREDVALVKEVFEDTEVGIAEGIQELENFIVENFPTRKNVITQKIETESGVEITDKHYAEVYIEAKKQLSGTKKQDVVDILEYKSNEYNPLIQYIENHRYLIDEGRTAGAIERLARTITSDSGLAGDMFDAEYEHHFLTKWLVGMIASIHGTHSPLVLALTGKQNTGKTEWLRRLLPEDLRKYYGEPDLGMSKDSDICMARFLVIMDDELSGKTRMETQHLKELTSRDEITVRMPYARAPVTLKRLAVLCGTSNETRILTDITGNRRIVPINVLKIDYSAYNKIDKDYLFMEAVRLFEEGYIWQLTALDVERLERNTLNYVAHSCEKELLQTYLRHPLGGEPVIFMNATMIGNYLMRRSEYRKVNVKTIGLEMQRMGFERVQKRINGHPMYGYEVSMVDVPAQV